MKKGIIIGITLLLMVGMIPAMASAGEHGGMDEMEHMGMGHFNYTAGTVDGRYVDFNIDQKTGEIENYMVNGTTVFTSVDYENSTSGNVRVRGANLFYFGMGAKMNWSDMNPKFGYMWRFLHSHDNPAGVLHIVVYGEDTITYRLADGISATPSGNHTVMLSGKINGLLAFSGHATVNDGAIVVKLGTTHFNFGNYTYYGGSAIFIRTGQWHFPREIKERIIQAIGEGKIGGEVRIGKYSDFVNYTYGFHARVQNAENNRISITVDSENHEGKVIMIDVNKSKLQYDSTHKIVVKIDGKEIRMSSENEVLAGGSDGKYAVIDNGASVTLMVYVPHFSEHTVDVESQATSPAEIMGNPMYLGIIIAIVIIVAIAAVAIIKKR